ncbi:uncharacterized protein EV422DRAFT_380878 [Fimicolochytrium jonesii]|uniref:uncharacterized protein n=1 Tax=Fimicolochytrium jonesii TaxID=1396493 RepID=UPI0022FE29AE|nr:uncharacterized protein EV422DRAFT_380878 [Fimicolochytrium jonesii]KAI8822842.1 hypothetical protein EV422DRAFT_380878 [Fimicolochytrium jonesii]
MRAEGRNPQLPLRLTKASSIQQASHAQIYYSSLHSTQQKEPHPNPPTKPTKPKMKFLATLLTATTLITSTTAVWTTLEGSNCSTCSANSCIYRMTDKRSDDRIDSDQEVACYRGHVVLQRSLTKGTTGVPHCRISFQGPGEDCKLNGKGGGWNPAVAARKTLGFDKPQQVGAVYFSRGCRAGATIRSEINNFCMPGRRDGNATVVEGDVNVEAFDGPEEDIVGDFVGVDGEEETVVEEESTSE